jgi:hypothetical protein
MSSAGVANICGSSRMKGLLSVRAASNKAFGGQAHEVATAGLHAGEAVTAGLGIAK